MLGHVPTRAIVFLVNPYYLILLYTCDSLSDFLKFVFSSKNENAKLSKVLPHTGTFVEAVAQVHPFTIVSCRMCILVK